MAASAEADEALPDEVGRSGREALRRRIVEAGAALVTAEGRDALTTRAVAQAVGVPSPTIYRLFEDKAALVDAVVDYGFASYLANKHPATTGDPLENFRAGWEVHVGFGLANPGLFSLMFGDSHPPRRSSAAMAAERILRERIRRLASAGLLRVSEDHAAELVQAVGQGVVLRLLAADEQRRDLSLIETSRDAVIAAITTARPAVEEPGPKSAAIALRAVLADVPVLTDNERSLMADWLDRIADNPNPPSARGAAPEEEV